MQLTVTIEGRDVRSRTLQVRLTKTQIDEAYELRRDCGLSATRDAVAESLARHRACVRVWGKHARWRDSGQGVAHRGQVWLPANPGENAATGVITMRVSSRERA